MLSSPSPRCLSASQRKANCARYDEDSFRVIHDNSVSSCSFLYIKSWMSRDNYNVENSTMSRNISGTFPFSARSMRNMLSSCTWFRLNEYGSNTYFNSQELDQHSQHKWTVQILPFSSFNSTTTNSVLLETSRHGRSSSDSGTKHFWWQLHWFHRVFDTGRFVDFFFFTRTWLRDSRILPSFLRDTYLSNYP